MNIKKTISSVLLMLSSLQAINPYTPDVSISTGEILYNEIQNAVSRATGKSFSNIPANERKNIYDRIQNELYKHNTYQSSFLKSRIEEVTITVLAEKAGRELEQYGRAQGLSPEQIKKLRTQYQNAITYSCKNAFSNCAQDSFDPVTMHAVIRNFIKKESEHSGLYNFFAGVVHLLEILSDSTPSAPTENKTTPPATSSRPPVSTAPSAPTYELVTNTFCSNSCCICMEDFGPHTPRFFLPCGHPLCSQDIQGWFFDQYKNTCPICRATCNSVQKTELRNALNPQVKSCCRCNKVKNDCIRLSNCNHYICLQCEFNWKNSANTFDKECPRCCASL